jgi:peptidoglycan/xylan/chitin deacetylase (PgdA/CDA1 family)
MHRKTPLVACVLAGMLGVSAASWPEIRTRALSSGPSIRGTLTAAFADRQWPKPKPGSWQPPARSPDGLPPVIKRINTRDKVVFLTLDDGWETDQRLVDIVRRQRVPFMTFLTEQAATGRFQYFWALKNAGSPMENHTISHPNMATLSPAEQRRQICRSADTINRQLGRRPQLLRPPFGSYNRLTRQAARDCGMKALLIWSAEFYNGTHSPGGVHNQFVRTDGGTGFRPGDIVLMHFRKGVGRDFATLLGWIRQQGFRPAPLQDYLPVSLGGTAPDTI